MTGEGEDFGAALFGVFGDPSSLAERKRRDRRSGMSKAQRARTAEIRSEQFNMRCTKRFKETAAGLAAKRGISVADLLDELVMQLAEKEARA